jgi:DNA-binding NarL/FixJ family response regulator
VVISSLKNICSKPKIIVTDNHAEDLLSALYAGADGFLYQGEMPSKSITTLEAILKSLK